VKITDHEREKGGEKGRGRRSSFPGTGREKKRKKIPTRGGKKKKGALFFLSTKGGEKEGR